jgi:hypothetical protein
MRPFAFLNHRVRGFRIVEVGALGVLLVLILAVYLAKTGAGAKRADIDAIQQQIFSEKSQIRVLKAEVASLEQPERLEALSGKYLGLVPVSARRELTAAGLADIAITGGAPQKAPLAGADPLTAKGSPDLPPADKNAAAPSSGPAGASEEAR